MQRATRGKRAQRGAIPGSRAQGLASIPREATKAPAVTPSRHSAGRSLPTLMGIGPRALPGVQPLAMPFEMGEILLTERKSYQVMSLIGAGEISLVVEALDREDARVVALKCLRPEFAAQQRAADYFLARARDNLAFDGSRARGRASTDGSRARGRASTDGSRAREGAGTDSEHIVRVHDAGRLADGTPFLAMDRLRGRDLRALLDDTGALLIKRATALALQLCEALAAGHAAGLVHCGLKPENLVVSREGAGERLVLLEFGTSCQGLVEARPREPAADARVPRRAPALWPPSYRPPEQRHRTGALDARSDIWSLGCILYEMLSGRAPRFGLRPGPDGSPREAPIVALRALRPELPGELAALVARCLAQDPGQRFQDVAELAHALAPFAPPTASSHARRCAELIEREPERVSGVRRVLRLDPVPVAREHTLDEQPRSAWLGPLALVLCVPIVSGLGWLYASQPPGWLPDALARAGLAPSIAPAAAGGSVPSRASVAAPTRSAPAALVAAPALEPPVPPAPASSSPVEPEGETSAEADQTELMRTAPASSERDRPPRATALKRVSRARPPQAEAAREPPVAAAALPFKPDPYSAPETAAATGPAPAPAP